MVKSKKERTESKEETKEPLERLLKIVLYLPKSWLILSTLFVLLSMLNITWAAKIGLSFAFQVSGVTAIFLALIWLPGLLRVFALIGGGAKTPMGEITSSGLGSWIRHHPILCVKMDGR